MTTLQSPPRTPIPIMAIGNENLQPPRTPQSNHNTQKFVLEKALASEGSDSNRVDHVQVPSSIPMNTEETEPKEDGGQDASVNEYQSGKEEHSLRNPIEEPAISPESHAEDVGERNSAEQNKNDLELPFFDWIKFEKEYQAAMSLADEEENLLITEFEKVCGVS